MKVIKEIKSFGILFGLASLTMGIVLLVMPNQTQNLLNTVVGVGLLVMGAFNMIQLWMKQKSEEKQPMVLWTAPWVTLILGIVILWNQNVTIVTTGVVVSILAFLLACDTFVVANNNRKMKKPIGMTVIFGVIHLLMGGLMLWNAFGSMMSVVVLAGIYLIINGVMVIASSTVFKESK